MMYSNQDAPVSPARASRFAAPFLSCCLFSAAYILSPAANANIGLPTLKAAPSAAQFIPAAQAFAFNTYQHNSELLLDWNIKSGYYLYKNKIHISLQGDGKLGEPIFPPATLHQDEYFGEVDIYRDKLAVKVPIIRANNAELKISYQGCAAAGFCYPPTTLTVPLTPVTPVTASNDNASAAAAQTATTTEPASPERSALTEVGIGEHWWQPLLFLLLGIGLAFTPCVLPMYPILTGIVLGGGKRTHRATFRLAMLYVQGMALTYTLLGLVVASAGVQFQAALQHPYVLIAISALFVVLAASMFGLFTLQLPASVQTKLTEFSNKQQGGNSLGVFAMGAISGLICSPCTTAPLSGALLYVAKSGDLLTGAITLYALAFGMGIPLVLAAMFGNKLLPRAGAWMEKVKTLFGFILLAAPLFFIERLVSLDTSFALWTLWTLGISAWLYHISRQLKPSKWVSLLAILAIIGISGAATLSVNHFSVAASSEQKLKVDFIKIKTAADLSEQLAAAKLAGKPVMLDLYADWCVACKDFEKYTFHQPDVAATLSEFRVLQADVTANDAQDVALLTQLQVMGLPTIEFWNANGEYLPNYRISGFLKPAPFINHIKPLLSASN